MSLTRGTLAFRNLAVINFVVTLVLNVRVVEAAPPDGWHRVAVLDERAIVYLPGQPKHEAVDRDTDDGVLHYERFQVYEDGVFLNVSVMTYPQATIDRQQTPSDLLTQLAANFENLKRGAEQLRLAELEELPYPALEHEFAYPAGKTGAGQMYAAGFAIWRHVLIDHHVLSLYVDVNGESYDEHPEACDALIDPFFGSLELHASPDD